ncbi:MAG: hypothetical protein M3552_03030 [Planctomycetota bacterium]|nr:hypothetical protein [Planctomycetota bacterium]
MIRFVICLSFFVLCGCSDDPPPTTGSESPETSPPTASDAEPQSDSPRVDEQTLLNEPKKKPGPPEKVAFLAPPELQAQFYYVSFAWTNGPGNWDYMTREERSQALLGTDGGFARNQYNGNTVRIKEVYYDPQNMKNRWQEELRNGQWVRHGPEVFYQPVEVLFSSQESTIFPMFQRRGVGGSGLLQRAATTKMDATKLCFASTVNLKGHAFSSVPVAKKRRGSCIKLAFPSNNIRKPDTQAHNKSPGAMPSRP